MRAQRALLLPIGAAALALAGCGISTEGADRDAAPSRPSQGGDQQRGQPLPRVRAPARPAGVVEVNGPVRSGFSPVVTAPAEGPGLRVTYAPTGEDAAFRAFCAGRVDVVESVRDISAAELAACRRRGIVVAPKIQVASDAVVVATRNESDVGGDCMTVADVNNIYRAGSNISNWSQLGFDNLQLTTTGPVPASNVFEFFTQRVFGVPSGAGLSAFRTDYNARPTDDEIRFLVINRAGVERERQLAQERLRRARRLDLRARQRAIAAAEREADRRALRRIEAVNERNRRRKITVDAEKLIRDNRRFVEREKAAARARVIKDYEERARRRADQENAVGLLRAERPGTVGYFRFTYYEQYEEQLRPFEIDATGLVGVGGSSSAVRGTQQRDPATRTTADPATRTAPRSTGARRPNCIFPSQTTVTNGQYPLARGILLYVSQQNLRRREVQTYLTNYLRNAQRLATANRLVPIPDAQRDQQISAITGTQPAGGQGGETGPRSADPGRSGVPGVSSSGPGQ